jgi:hypothetical protein
MTTWYFDPRKWTLAPAAPPQPGKLRVGILGALALMPLLGLLFVVFLPVIGFVLVGQALMARVKGPVASLAARQALPQAAPGSAYLLGRETLPGANAEAEGVADLEAEVRRRRCSDHP